MGINQYKTLWLILICINVIGGYRAMFKDWDNEGLTAFWMVMAFDVACLLLFVFVKH